MINAFYEREISGLGLVYIKYQRQQSQHLDDIRYIDFIEDNGNKYSKTCHTWTRAYVDTHPTMDKTLYTNRILSIYPLIRGQTCHAWTVDTKKCPVEQNYLLICGHLAVSSGDAMVLLMK